MIEKNFDIPFVASMALREKQIQQNYRPIIAVHKWFARRPGTLFRSLLLSEFTKGPLRERYFETNNLKGIRVGDPFIGGGTPLVEANRLGCEVVGYDINPMAYWIVRQEIEYLDLRAYRHAASKLTSWLEQKVGELYRTRCLLCGTKDAHAKYFLWVKIQDCKECHKDFDLFSGYLLAEDRRHPQNVFICPVCGELNEAKDRQSPGNCHSCASRLSLSGPAKRNRCNCPHCGVTNSYQTSQFGPPKHRMFAIEYFCIPCKKAHRGRFFKKPDKDDLAKLVEVENIWSKIKPTFVPKDQIPPGDETDRLHRWGYQYYREMFNTRQLLGLELSCRAIAELKDERVRNALATNLSDLLRYQNMLCRYDTMALKSLDIFSVHGFPVGLIQCESNLLGITNDRSGAVVGSGGWVNIIGKYSKAKAYCDEPFEIQSKGNRGVQVPIVGEWIGDQRDGSRESEKRRVSLKCKSTTLSNLSPRSLDVVLTDPPYFGNVQYAELMDFCYVWLRQLLGATEEAFETHSTRNKNELTGNLTLDRGLPHFTEGLSKVFIRMAKALKLGSPLAFTYHHNTLEAYYPIAVAILDSGLTCSASIPCPAEMGASIHINGTGSSIIDTVFVCRSHGKLPKRWIVNSAQGVADLVREDIAKLCAGNVSPTRGDIRCIIFGHLIRMAVWNLKKSWDRTRASKDRISDVASQTMKSGGLEAVEQCLGQTFLNAKKIQNAIAREEEVVYRMRSNEVPFEQYQANPEEFVSAVFSCLESEFLIMPKGEGFIGYSVFESGYEALKKATSGFINITPSTILNAALDVPIAIIVVRAMLGFTPPEWAYVATQRTGVEVSQGFVRTLDRRIRMAPLRPLAKGGAAQKRVKALIETACQLLREGAPKVESGKVHRLCKADTQTGPDAIRTMAGIGVPYAMLLYERFLGRPFADHRDSVSELIGDSMESAIEDVLSKANISFRKTKRAERILGFDQAPDFIIPSEFNPQVVIEAKITEDDGTARDKITRVQHLGHLSTVGQPSDQPKYEVIACIGGRGFGVRREDMKKLLTATKGKVFTLKTLDKLVEFSRLKEFRAS